MKTLLIVTIALIAVAAGINKANANETTTCRQDPWSGQITCSTVRW